MSFSILSWNVYGLGRVEKRMQIKDIVNSSSMELLVFVGFKMKSIPCAFMCQIFPFALVDGVCLPFRGSAGGIWVV